MLLYQARRCIELWRGGGSLAVQQLERLGVHAFIAGRDDASAFMRPPVLPSGDDAAGAFDDRNEWQDVVRFKFGLDHEIDMAGRQHTISVAITAVARQSHRLLD